MTFPLCLNCRQKDFSQCNDGCGPVVQLATEAERDLLFTLVGDAVDAPAFRKGLADLAEVACSVVAAWDLLHGPDGPSGKRLRELDTWLTEIDRLRKEVVRVAPLVRLDRAEPEVRVSEGEQAPLMTPGERRVLLERLVHAAERIADYLQHGLVLEQLGGEDDEDEDEDNEPVPVGPKHGHERQRK